MFRYNPTHHARARAARRAASGRARPSGDRVLRLALDAADLGVWEVDLLRHRSLWSRGARELLALPVHGPVTDDQIAASLHPEDRALFRESWRRAAETIGTHACEVRVMRPDGSNRLVRLRGRTTPGHDGDSGKPAFRSGTVTDAPQRGRTGEDPDSLQAEARRLAPIGAFAWELPSRRAVWTEEVFRILGQERGATLPTVGALLEHVHPEDRAELERLLESGIATGEAVQATFRVARPDGIAVVAVRQGGAVRGPPGEPLRVVGTLQDLTAELREQGRRHEASARVQRERAAESLTVLSAGVAHAFGNLLSAVLGNLDLASEGVPAGSSQRTALERAKAAGSRAASLSTQLLACSGRGKVSLERVDGSALVRAMADVLRSSVPPATQVRLDLGEDLPDVEVDVAQIRQLVLSLVLNAGESLPATGGTIRVRTCLAVSDGAGAEEAAGTGGQLGASAFCLEVTDDGHGMDEHTRARVFEPFFSTRFAGRGLGMAVVLGIVLGHAGAVEVRSAPHRGTTVRVLLPVAVPRSAATAGAAVKGAAPAAAEPVVLVIDDDTMVRTVARLMLEHRGYTVLAAADGGAGLRLFRERGRAIGAIVLDLTMPVLSGEQVLREIRRIDRTVPVLVVSGYSEQDSTLRLAELGIAGFVRKPFDLATLTAAVEAMLPPPTPRGAPAAAPA